MAPRSKSTTRGKKRGLTTKQAVFVEEYLVDLNATQAAIRAGYSERTAKQQGTRLLSNAVVAEGIAEALGARSERVEVTADQVLRELAKMGFSNMLDYITAQDDGTAFVDLSKLTRDQAAAISEVNVETYWEPGIGEDEPRQVKKIKFKLSDKRGNLELLGKHLGMFKPVGGADNPLTIAPQEPDLSGLSDEDLRLHRELRRKIAHGRTE